MMGDVEAPEAPVKQEASLDTSPESSVLTAANEKELATIRETFSFGSGPKKHVSLVLGFFCACVGGCVFPAMTFFFADSFKTLAAFSLSQTRELAFTFMILGVVAFVFMSGQAFFFEVAAGVMTRDLETTWFDALLRQDMTYFDIKDISATATIRCRRQQIVYTYRYMVGWKLDLSEKHACLSHRDSGLLFIKKF